MVWDLGMPFLVYNIPIVCSGKPGTSFHLAAASTLQKRNHEQNVNEALKLLLLFVFTVNTSVIWDMMSPCHTLQEKLRPLLQATDLSGLQYLLF